ncbi:MAG: GAF domain-containing protein, partial [bacterium]|nr:GAF domain-containing protein [bacterium]
MTLFFVVIVLVAIIPSMFLVAFGNGANPISAARLAVCAGLGIVAALISAFFLTRSITRPLKELRRRIEILSTGNLDQKFLLERNDEIGELALDIDRMRRYLKFRIIELEKLFRVGKAISSELDFKQLLNIILDTIIGEIGAESGSIMLLNEEDKYLTIAVAKHLPEDVINNTRVFLGEGIVGKVAETGERIMIEDVENSEVFKKQKNEGVNRGGSLLSVPLKVKDKTLGTEKVLGVINVSKSEAGAFRYH